MRAIVYEKYGPPDVLQLADLGQPRPGDDDVLIRVRASTVAAPDWRMRRPSPWIARLVGGVFRPRHKVLGYEFSGVIEEVGRDVERFKVGDAVFGENVKNGVARFGAYAEFLVMPQNGLMTLKPDGMSFEAAAAVPSGAMTALLCLKKMNIQAGHKVLINGASGSIGTYAVQLARRYGAAVTGVCSTNNVALVESLGAERVLDYTRERLSTIDERYDLILDAVGKSSFWECRHLLNDGGQYLSTGLGSLVSNLFFVAWTARFSRRRAVLNTTVHSIEILSSLVGMIEDGSVKPVIDRCYPLEKVAEAHGYVEQGHKVGNVVVVI